ncbi:MAG TPA: IS91 family transposase, partial [Bacteroidales bacterium]
PRFELAQVIDRYRQEFEQQYHPNRYVSGVLTALQQCRTSALGGHVDRCDTCGHIQISYNSCRNRHCPKCQGNRREEWVRKRMGDLLPVPYFHVVFTVPDLLNPLFLHRDALMYNILFAAVRQTIEQFSFTRLQAETGMFAVLHTWGQNLGLHPHIHCVVPGGGLNCKNQWKRVPVSDNGKVFLFPVRQLSVVFRAKFIAMLQQQLPQDTQFISNLYKIQWVVYAKEPFGGPQQVIEYLGRYTHKVAISNHRIQNIDSRGVSFTWLDYRDNREKLMTLSGVEFLRRFCQHIVPRHFVRIRHFGLLSCAKRKVLRMIQNLLKVNPTSLSVSQKKHKGHCVNEVPFYCCPQCKVGQMQIVGRWFSGRDPPGFVKRLIESIQVQ